MLSAPEKYMVSHSTLQDEALGWIEKQTNIRTNYPQMLSGAVQGKLLEIIAAGIGAKKILEIGTFTGYSAVCLARGAGESGTVDTIEINDELEDLIREGWHRAGVDGRITLHVGDAGEIIPTLAGPYDLVYIDANKREYPDYYELVLPKLRKRGMIIADDVMLGGKVYADNVPQDAQTRGLIAFNDLVASDPRIEVVMLPLREGLSIIVKK